MLASVVRVWREEQPMRRFASLAGVALLGALVVSLCGCGGEGGPIGATGAQVNRLLPGALEGQPEMPAATGKIAFVSTRDTNPPGSWPSTYQIYIMGASGAGQQRLPSPRGNDFWPRWSPNGARLAFASDRDDPAGAQMEIYVMGANGSGATRLTYGGGMIPCWSPDGRRIAFVSDRDGNSDLYVMNANGSGVRRLTTQGGNRPDWSPDGRRILFTRDGIWVMNANGSGQKKLARSKSGDAAPSWSPDGRRIAFVREAQIYVMNADGTKQQKLTRSIGSNESPRWSPNGRRIVFASDRANPGEAVRQVYAMNADGSKQQRLTTQAMNCDPDW
jgi:TolB protein